MTSVSLSGLQANVQNKDGYTTLSDYLTVCENFLLSPSFFMTFNEPAHLRTAGQRQALPTLA